MENSSNSSNNSNSAGAFAFTALVAILLFYLVAGIFAKVSPPPAKESRPQQITQKASDGAVQDGNEDKQPQSIDDDFSLNVVCLPCKNTINETNKVQDTLITVSNYLNQKINPVNTYELDPTKNYIMVAEITMPTNVKRKLQEMVGPNSITPQSTIKLKKLGFDADSRISKFQFEATLSHGVHYVKDMPSRINSVLFFDNTNNDVAYPYKINYLYSVYSDLNKKGEYALSSTGDAFIEDDTYSGLSFHKVYFYKEGHIKSDRKFFIVYDVTYDGPKPVPVDIDDESTVTDNNPEETTTDKE